jgi:hypothetical protein
MPNEQHEWTRRIKAVEREYAVMRLAVDRLREAAKPDPTILRGAFKIGEIGKASDLLEGTYVIRIYAEFETGLRSFWEASRDTHPPMRQLLDAIASSQGTPDHDLVNAHKARRYRNGLVHERDGEEARIALPIFRRYLTMYFRHLPPSWDD